MTARDYNGQAPLVCWPTYWQVMAARSAEPASWWAVMAAKVREWWQRI